MGLDVFDSQNLSLMLLSVTLKIIAVSLIVLHL